MQNITDTMIMPGGQGAPQRLAQYEILREAGRGGMSVVYEALDRHTQRTVALKVLTVPQGLGRDQAEAMLGRFAREARAVAGLSHPNIVTISEVGEEDGRHFLVMEYLRGESLRDRLARGPLTPAQALPVLSQIAAALDAVHAQGVVHRDIKPSNVMLLPDGAAKLLDFGVARQSDDTTITGTGALVGSPAYLSPEQVRGAEGTPASDIWALGALLYEMLAGHPPFTGRSIPAVLYQVTHEAPPPVIGIATPAQRVLRRALDKNPARRYPSACALADALRAALPESRPSPPPRRLPLWPWAALLPVLLGLSLIALTLHRSPAPRPAPPRPVAMTAPAAAPRAPVTGTPPRHRATRRSIARKHSQARRTVRAASDREVRVRHRSVSPRRRARRFRPVVRRPTRRRNSGDNSAAVSRLEHFIYSPGPP